MWLLCLVILVRLADIAVASPASSPPNGCDAAAPIVKRAEATDLLARDGPGETTVCRSNMDIGPCETLSANSACVPFGDELRHNIRNVYQAYGSICKYYDGSCDAPTPVMSLNSHNHAVHVPLDKATGDRISAVRCQDQWLNEVSQDGTTQIFPRSNDVALMSRGDVQACKYTKLMGIACTDLNALNSCKVFNDDFAEKIDTLKQAAGSICTYWKKKDCSGPVVTSVSGPQDYSPNLGPGNQDGKVIVAVSCQVSRASGMLNVGTTVSYNIEEGGSATEIGDVQVCSCEIFQGNCWSANARDLCWLLDETKHSARSWRQSEGLVCTFWAGPHGCEKALFEIATGSLAGQLAIIPAAIADATTAISCIARKATEGHTPLNTTPQLLAPLEKREASVSMTGSIEPGPQAGQVDVYAQEHLAGQLQHIDTMTDDNNCSPLFNQFFWNLYSLTQFQGSVCTYWQYNCGDLSDENKPVFTVDSRGGQIGLSIIPEVFGGDNRHKIAYIRCISGPSADALMATLHTSDPTIIRGAASAAREDAQALATRQHGDQVSSRDAADYFEPLWLCHDENGGGRCQIYAGPSCGLNPFGVDAIKSFAIYEGFKCAFYPAWGCQFTNGPPHYASTTSGTYYNNHVDFVILSISCFRWSGPSGDENEALGETEINVSEVIG
jgi:hypothetical protein